MKTSFSTGTSHASSVFSVSWQGYISSSKTRFRKTDMIIVEKGDLVRYDIDLKETFILLIYVQLIKTFHIIVSINFTILMLI